MRKEQRSSCSSISASFRSYLNCKSHYCRPNLYKFRRLEFLVFLCISLYLKRAITLFVCFSILPWSMCVYIITRIVYSFYECLVCGSRLLGSNLRQYELFCKLCSKILSIQSHHALKFSKGRFFALRNHQHIYHTLGYTKG